MKIVINKSFGGFGLSPEATIKLWERGVSGIATPVEEYFGDRFRDDQSSLGYPQVIRQWREYVSNGHKDRDLFITVFSPDEKHVLYARDIERNNPELIRIVEEMGEKANGACADLGVVEIPDGIDWFVDEYDGNEHVAQKHQTWR